jgi:hypothetical protein
MILEPCTPKLKLGENETEPELFNFTSDPLAIPL